MEMYILVNYLNKLAILIKMEIMQKELELADYWDIIVKYIAMIIWITLFVVIGVLIYLLIILKIYESEAVIKLGDVWVDL